MNVDVHSHIVDRQYLDNFVSTLALATETRIASREIASHTREPTRLYFPFSDQCIGFEACEWAYAVDQAREWTLGRATELAHRVASGPTPQPDLAARANPRIVLPPR